jgi:formate hydrogenlyase subunit 4
MRTAVLLKTVGLLMVPVLYAGVLAHVEATVAHKRGPHFMQRYRHLLKWPRNSGAIIEQASWVFRGASFVAFACYLTVSAIISIITKTSLSQAFSADLTDGGLVLTLPSFVISRSDLGTARALDGLGASRSSWIGSFAKTLVLLFFPVGAVSDLDKTYLMLTKGRSA